MRGVPERGQSPSGFHGEELGLSLHVPGDGLAAELRLLSYFFKARWVPPTATAPLGARLGGRAPHAAWGDGKLDGDRLETPSSPPGSQLPQIPLLPFQEGSCPWAQPSLNHPCPRHHPPMAQHGGCPELPTRTFSVTFGCPRDLPETLGGGVGLPRTEKPLG